MRFSARQHRIPVTGFPKQDRQTLPVREDLFAFRRRSYASRSLCSRSVGGGPAKTHFGTLTSAFEEPKINSDISVQLDSDLIEVGGPNGCGMR